jgi:hypothetical protein
VALLGGLHLCHQRLAAHRSCSSAAFPSAANSIPFTLLLAQAS